MKKYLIYAPSLILTVYALYKLEQYEKKAIVQRIYTQLITLLEQGSQTDMSQELMQKIISVYNDKFLSESGPNYLNPFMECVKIHQDVLVIMKKAPNIVSQFFKLAQDDFLRELHMLKTCTIVGKSPSWDRLTATQLIEASYLKFLLFQFARNKDFYDRYLAEAIAKDLFTPAVAMTLYMKVFGISPQRLIEAPKVYVIQSQHILGKILLIAPMGGAISLKTCYTDSASGQISKILFLKNGKNKCVEILNSSEVVFFSAREKFYSWDDKNCIISFHGINEENCEGTASFQFDHKNMRWVDAKSEPAL
jgi:hypothetical protein